MLIENFFWKILFQQKKNLRIYFVIFFADADFFEKNLFW